MHPERIAVVAGLLIASSVWLFFVRRQFPWPLIVASIGWTLFAPWEWFCKVQRYNIRVDLLLISPVLLALTAWGVIAAVVPHPWSTGSSTKWQFSLRTLLITTTLVALALGMMMWLIR
jgi:hypothetical protein